MFIKKSVLSILVLLTFLASTACTPEVGTQEWCTHMKEKSKADWTANEAGAYAEHCLL